MAIREIYHDAETIQRNVESGVWLNTTLDDYLQQHARDCGDKLALVDRRWRLTYADLNRLAHRTACGLLQLGVTSGDVVSLQTPNWAEWLILHCAITKIGAVTNSIGAIYRHKEVSYILDYAESVLMLIPDTFRGFSYTDMMRELWPDLPQLQQLLVVGESTPDGMRSFQDFIDTPWEDHYADDDLATLRPDPNQVATLMFTSGTTADPKGVMHTHNTMGIGTKQILDTYRMSAADVVFMASPIGHTTALIAGARLPIMYGMTAVWQEHWNPEEAVETVQREGCTMTLSATPFLHGFTYAANANRESLRPLKVFGCGGAPIPRELIKRAEEDQGFFVSAIYGSSEALVNTAITVDDPISLRYSTDGKVIPTVEARIVDPETGTCLGVGEEGELQLRSPALYVGYYKDPDQTHAVRHPDGWYSTGDLCTLDAENYLNVVGRKKDLIIRGGYNIGAREIEELLFTHPKIMNCACVAMPDPILAERVCAYVICNPGTTLSFDEMIEFLKSKRIAVWKLPERLEIQDEFPMTPSGKIQKYVLRQEIAALLQKEVTS